MTRKIKALAVAGLLIAGAYLLNLTIKAGCYLLLIYFSL